MKKIIALMLVFLPILTGCSHKAKGRIEAAFDKYASETFADKNEFKGIESIELTDSTDFYATANSLVSLTDETLATLDSVLKSLTLTLPMTPNSKIYSAEVQRKLKRHLENLDEYKFDIAWYSSTAESLRVLLDSVSGLNRINKSYKLKVRLKSNPEFVTYYAQDFALADTIIFSKEPIEMDCMPEMMKKVYLLMQQIISKNEIILEVIQQAQSVITALQN